MCDKWNEWSLDMVTEPLFLEAWWNGISRDFQISSRRTWLCRNAMCWRTKGTSDWRCYVKDKYDEHDNNATKLERNRRANVHKCNDVISRNEYC